jgi:hypothetical protein
MVKYNNITYNTTSNNLEYNKFIKELLQGEPKKDNKSISHKFKEHKILQNRYCLCA